MQDEENQDNSKNNKRRKHNNFSKLQKNSTYNIHINIYIQDIKYIRI